jgi:hypothetical protein
MTATGTVAVLLPAVAVTVMVRLAGSPAALKVAVAAPFALVVAWVTVKPPEVAEKLTATPDTNWFCALRTSAVMVADLLLSDGICGTLVITLMVCWVFATVTVVLPDIPPLVAVTVITVPAAAVPAVSVAVATPLALVVAWVTVSAPAEEVNVTVAPDTALFLASCAVALMVALVLPSAAILVVLVLTVMVATAAPGVTPVVLDVDSVIVSLPPHAASISAALTHAIIRNLRILCHPSLDDSRRSRLVKI